MDISLILKVGGVGFLVSGICQVLSKSGREEQSLFVSVSGMIVVLLLLIGQLSELIGTVREVFGLWQALRASVMFCKSAAVQFWRRFV